MPNPGINLQDRRVIVSVFVILIAVLVLNWRVFQPLRAGHVRRTTQQEEAMRLPADLGDMTGFVSAQMFHDPSGADRVDVSTPGANGSERDPFRNNPTRGSHAGRERHVQSKRAPVCSAVFLAGTRSTALINGKAYRPGDTVPGDRTYTVEKITGDGVTLSAGGSTVFLPVGSSRKKGSVYPLITDKGRSGGE